ncbi:MAG: FAD-dependent oxidoreductase [Pseudomonadota bacterium]
MKTHARVVVIGGGAVGASILYHLALAGITDTLLIEKDELTAGSTWHAAGNIPTYATSWLGMRAGNYGWRLYKDLGDKVGAPITYRHTGAFWPAHTEERMDLFRHLTGVSRSAGFDLAMITPQEMEDMHPYYTARADQPGGVIGGIYDPYEGDIDPSQLTQALAKGARDLGAEVARFTEVTSIGRSASGEWKIGTSKGTVACETVINAGGFYGAKIGEMAGAPVPVTTLQHQYLVTEPLDALEADTRLFPLIRDPEIRFYLRRERSSFLLGSYAHEGRVAWPDGPPGEFAHQLFPDDLDELGELIEETVAHVPLLGEAGVQRCVNGPIAYAPDALPLVGPAAGVSGFYHATGVQIGITHSAAIGKAMAEWLTEGETEWDLSAWDPRRFGEWATQDYAGARASEHYGLQYAISYPHRIMRSARPVQRTPLYETLVGKGAIFGQIGGWERAFWFGDPGATADNPYGHLSFRDDEPWHAAVRAECDAVQNHVGIMDHGGFTKFEVEGAGATGFLDRVFCGKLPAPGRVRLSYMLTPKGRLWSEATVAHLDEDRFLLCGPTLAVDRDFDWLSAHLPDDGSVTLRKGADKDAALMLMGPKSRQLLAGLTDADLSAAAQPWMSVTGLEIAGIPVLAMRVSYVGELGWELHVSSDDLPELYGVIQEAGGPLGLRDFGSYALNVMRVEKGYHGWGSDFGTEYTPFDAGLARFVAFDKPEFVGRDALLELRNETPDWAFCGFEIDSADADAMPSDPILSGDQVAGYVTSAAYGYRTGKRLALGYLERGPLSEGDEFDIEILGVRRRAHRRNLHFYDPDNSRLKA